MKAVSKLRVNLEVSTIQLTTEDFFFPKYFTSYLTETPYFYHIFSICLLETLSSLHKFYLLLVLFPGGCHTKTSALRINLSNLPSLSVNYCPSWSLLQSFPFINIYWHTLVNLNTVYILCKRNIYFHFRRSFISLYDATLVKLFYLGIVSFLEI